MAKIGAWKAVVLLCWPFRRGVCSGLESASDWHVGQWRPPSQGQLLLNNSHFSLNLSKFKNWFWDLSKTDEIWILNSWRNWVENATRFYKKRTRSNSIGYGQKKISEGYMLLGEAKFKLSKFMRSQHCFICGIRQQGGGCTRNFALPLVLTINFALPLLIKKRKSEKGRPFSLFLNFHFSRAPTPCSTPLPMYDCY